VVYLWGEKVILFFFAKNHGLYYNICAFFNKCGLLSAVYFVFFEPGYYRFFLAQMFLGCRERTKK